MEATRGQLKYIPQKHGSPVSLHRTRPCEETECTSVLLAVEETWDDRGGGAVGGGGGVLASMHPAGPSPDE